mmetsp:Transcript_104872/g.264306  ORF Transcript_104872/g.264306 Transcript_104872/m.264306 type:complete len:209 (-) Transcript_104872:63-689(-)
MCSRNDTLPEFRLLLFRRRSVRLFSLHLLLLLCDRIRALAHQRVAEEVFVAHAFFVIVACRLPRERLPIVLVIIEVVVIKEDLALIVDCGVPRPDFVQCLENLAFDPVRQQLALLIFRFRLRAAAVIRILVGEDPPSPRQLLTVLSLIVFLCEPLGDLEAIIFAFTTVALIQQVHWSLGILCARSRASISRRLRCGLARPPSHGAKPN